MTARPGAVDKAPGGCGKLAPARETPAGPRAPPRSPRAAVWRGGGRQRAASRRRAGRGAQGRMGTHGAG